MPTLMEVIGAADRVPDDIDGISLVATLRGRDQPPRPYLYREFSEYGGQQSIRVGDWKGIRQQMSRGNLQVELYNLADDVSETNDLAAKHPDRVSDLARMMEEVRTPSELFPLIPLDKPARPAKKK